jgi:hypothetical protein
MDDLTVNLSPPKRASYPLWSTAADNADTASSSKRNYVSIQDVDLNESKNMSYGEILDSPLTLLAMNNLGILVIELNGVSYETVHI